jgi:hypothetical protein
MSALFSKPPKDIGTLIMLQPDQWLGEYKYDYDDVDFTKGLPNGVLKKKYTGLGATTCELNAPRNSILVFPYLLLAKEKADKSPDYFFFKTVDSKIDNKKCNFEELRNYINKKKTAQKICLVVDNIEKLINALKELNLKPYRNYFLLFDEVETLQLQSGFRHSITKSFDYFKDFDEKCLVTATPIKFNDAEIRELDNYTVSIKVDKTPPAVGIIEDDRGEPINWPEPVYEDFKPINLKYLVANNIIGEVAMRVISVTKEHPDKKLLIGINSKREINEFITVLKEEGGIELKDIGVIASDNSELDFVKEVFVKIENEELPRKINIATSIVYSGIDIKEQYIAIAISLKGKPHHLFSRESLIQFLGRCRHRRGLYGAFLYVDSCVKEVSVPKVITDDEFNEKEKDYIQLIDAIPSNNNFSKKEISSINESLATTKTENPSGLLYLGKNMKCKINYLARDVQEYVNNIINEYLDFEHTFIEGLKEFMYVKEVSNKKTYYTENGSIVSDIVARDELLSSQVREDKAILKLLTRDRKDYHKKHEWLCYLFVNKVFDKVEDRLTVFDRLTDIKYHKASVLKSIFESLILYSVHYPKFKKFTEHIIKAKGTKKTILLKDLYDAINSSSAKPYLTAIKNKTISTNFFELFFDIEKENASEAKFNLDGKNLSPAFLFYPGFKEKMGKVIDLNSRKGFKSKSSLSLSDLLFYNFEDFNI